MPRVDEGALYPALHRLELRGMMAAFLYGTSPRDPVILGASALLMVCIAGAASLFPAVRASRIDPIVAIRYE